MSEKHNQNAELLIQQLSRRIDQLESLETERRQKKAEKKGKEAEKAAAKASKKAKTVSNGSGLFDTTSEPRKSFSTFLRNQNKLYVNAINAIDRKAAIMIRINSTIISAVVIFFEYVREIPGGAGIALLFVFFSFLSLMLAINASRPHFFNIFRSLRKNVQHRYNQVEENIFAIGANTELTLEEYQEAFNKIVTDQGLQIGNQVRAMYLFEKRQRDSFFHIEMAYLAFMAGFSIVVVAFIIGNLKGLFH